MIDLRLWTDQQSIVARALGGSSKQETPIIAQNVGIPDFGIFACIRLIIRNLDDCSRIERRKSLRFRSGADSHGSGNAHFKTLIKNDLQITSLVWHPVC
jgi:hypothetical protein